MNSDFKMKQSVSDYANPTKTNQSKTNIKGFGIIGKEKKSKVRKALDYVIGSIAIYVAAWVFIPEMMTHVSGKINKIVTKSSNRKHEKDDWGPEIVKKNTNNKE